MDWRLIVLIVTLAGTAGFNADLATLGAPATRFAYWIGYLRKFLTTAAVTLLFFWIFQPSNITVSILTWWLIISCVNLWITRARLGGVMPAGWPIFLLFFLLVCGLTYAWAPTFTLPDFNNALAAWSPSP